LDHYHQLPLITTHEATKKFAVCLPFRRRNNRQSEANQYSILQCHGIGKSKTTNESATIGNSQQQHGIALLTGGL
jgi:hypothetical protein